MKQEKQVTDETREVLVSLDEKQKEFTEYQTNIVHILADWFQRRRLLNNFPIGPMLKLCPLTVAILDRDRGH